MKRVWRFAFALLGTVMFLVAGLVAVLSLRPAPPFYVAYAERKEAVQVVNLARTDGADVRALTPHHKNSWSPIWSLDGTRLAFLSEDMLSGTQLQVVDQKQERRAMLLTRQRFLLSPAWSPDSDWIAFSAFRNGRHSIFRIMVDTPRLHQMTDDSGNEFSPTWSPDGRWLAFASDRDHQNGNDIYRIRIDAPANSRLERLTFAPESRKRSLAWSPDGEQIAFIARDGNEQHLLYTLHVRTGELRDITQVYAPEKDWQLSWSSDAEWIYVLKAVDGQPIWHRVQPNGENLIPMPELATFQDSTWSPSEEKSRIGVLVVLIMGAIVCSLLVLLRTQPQFSRQPHNSSVTPSPKKPHRSLLTNP